MATTVSSALPSPAQGWAQGVFVEPDTRCGDSETRVSREALVSGELAEEHDKDWLQEA